MDSLAVSASDDPTDPDDTGEPDTSEPDDPADPISDLSVVVDEVSNWGSGYCSNVIVTNNSASEETWVIVESVAGTISSLWNAVSEPVSGGIQFSGVSWNGTLQSNQSAEFGFCADL
jgi:cellulase/cellobiase CelA1